MNTTVSPELEKKIQNLKRSLQMMLPAACFGIFFPIILVFLPFIGLIYAFQRRSLLKLAIPEGSLSPEAAEGLGYIRDNGWRAWFPLICTVIAIVAIIALVSF